MRIGDTLAYDCGVAAERVGAHGAEKAFGIALSQMAMSLPSLAM